MTRSPLKRATLSQQHRDVMQPKIRHIYVTGDALKHNTEVKHATACHLSVDRYVAVAQREARGHGGGHGRSREVNGVLIQSVEDGVGGPAVTHVHDAER